WYGENSAHTTHAVGTRPASPWGLYDMAGNVSEWVQDWIGLNYPGGRVVDPQGPATGVTRTLRRGRWGRSGERNVGHLSLTHLTPLTSPYRLPPALVKEKTPAPPPPRFGHNTRQSVGLV